jgi:hypothetical protein
MSVINSLALLSTNTKTLVMNLILRLTPIHHYSFTFEVFTETQEVKEEGNIFYES